MEVKSIFNQSALPQQAEIFYEEFCQNYKSSHNKAFSHKEAGDFLKVFGNSDFLSVFVKNFPESYDVYKKDLYHKKEKPLSQFQKEISQILQNSHEIELYLKQLKKYKYQEYLRLTIKELTHQDQSIIYRELSHLVFAIGEYVLQFIENSLCKKFDIEAKTLCDYGIIAMGKLGGLEVNYSSDIDLIALYDFDQSLKETTFHEFFTKMIVEFTRIMQKSDSLGFLFRVDWDLRPEGSSGTLVNSFTAMEKYYETFGQEWERQAYIKAYPLFEKKHIVTHFQDFMQPFVYRKSFDEQTVQHIKHVKDRMHNEVQKGHKSDINIKLDRGCIREIEFFVQTFQLLYAGKIPELKQQNTLLALKQLEKAKLISPQESQFLDKAYRFLRKIESSIQMQNEQQTHVLKADNKVIVQIAKRCGFLGSPDEIFEKFSEDLIMTRENIQDITKKLWES